jgi:hypothetical protein
MISYLILSVLLSFGLSVILVEKSDKWPVNKISDFIRYILSYIPFVGTKFKDVLDCTVCTSFWMGILSDLILLVYFCNEYRFLWPVTGILALAFTWSFFQVIDAIESKVIKIVDEREDDD